MIERYSLPRMKEVWSEEARLQSWLQIEVLAAEAMAELGMFPKDDLEIIRKRARFDPARVREIEQTTRHDVNAFIMHLGEVIGPEARFLHMGMTSSDVLDTGLALQLRDAAEILIEDTSRLLGVIKTKAFEYRDTPMMGRSHGVHAEIITFGAKLAVWAFEARRNIERLQRAQNAVSYGKVSGAVGVYANIDPFIEKYVCDRLGLRVAEASSQILQRDRHAEYMSALAICAGSLEKYATEIRALQKTEVMEVEEPFKEGQTGSSAMPHKRNPIICERVCGLARVIRGNASVAFENMALWHERDISHSSAERVILPDSTILLDYITGKFCAVMEGLVVYPWKMEKNIGLTGGLVFSEKVLLSLVNKGLSRQESYNMVQRNAMKSVRGEGEFMDNLLHDEQVSHYMLPEEIMACFDPREGLGRVNVIFERLEELKVKP